MHGLVYVQVKFVARTLKYHKKINLEKNDQAISEATLMIKGEFRKRSVVVWMLNGHLKCRHKKGLDSIIGQCQG